MLIYLEDRPAEVDRLKVCSICSQVYGPWVQRESGRNPPQETEYVQLCRCGKPDATSDAVSKQPIWQGFDFNEYATICYSCGLVALPSGSKWSVWFCSWCKGQVWKLNERHGAAVVPIGRHSLMNGVFLRPTRPEPEDEEIDQFVVELNGLFGRGDVLREWSRSVIKKNVAFVDPDGTDPLLEHYVAVVQWYAESNVDWSDARGWVPLSKPEAFAAMWEFVRKSIEGGSETPPAKPGKARPRTTKSRAKPSGRATRKASTGGRAKRGKESIP